MINIIAGGFAISLFLAFVVGLSISIHEYPFIIIAVGVGGMAVYDFYESVRDEAKENKAKRGDTA